MKWNTFGEEGERKEIELRISLNYDRLARISFLLFSPPLYLFFSTSNSIGNNKSITLAIFSGSKTNQNRHQISPIFITQFAIENFSSFIRINRHLLEQMAEKGKPRDKCPIWCPGKSVNVPEIEKFIPKLFVEERRNFLSNINLSS